MELAGLLKEAEEDGTIIIPKGTHLFHGTGEEFDSQNPRGGSYDKIFWTTKDPAISQTYIPVAGMTFHMGSSFLAKPSLQKHIIDMQKQIGIEYSDMEGDSRQITSWREAPVFSEISEKSRQGWDNFMKATKEFEEFDKNMQDNWPSMNRDEKIEISKKYESLKSEIEVKRKDWHDSNLDRAKNDYVNKKLEKLGYTPEHTYDSDHNFSWSIKVSTKGGKESILPAEYRHPGRLFIVTPQEDLKIYDLTLGGSVEGDLTNVDYHQLEFFKKVEERGFDGIKINDFAQIESEDNFGHTSIGLFKNTLAKVKVSETPAVHPKDFGEKHLRTRDYNTDEYNNWLKSQA